MANGKRKSTKGPKQVEALTHEEARRKNIPTAELQSLAERAEESAPRPPVHYPRATPLPEGETRPRDGDLDPQIIWNGVKIKLTKEQIRALETNGQIEVGEAQLVWRGKDNQDWSDLVVQVPPLYIQEKIHPKFIIDDLVRRTREKAQEETDAPDLFADFNGLDPEARLEFYSHDQHWSNRMILGDSLQVMASLAEREGLKGKVQCIYIDPPYGIKFNSNWQVSTQSRDVKDGKREDVSREPEQVKAFRDTWKDGIHSYLTYLRDRLTVAKELLTDSGSIFVQIGDENVHRIRALMDEVFGDENHICSISIQKTGSISGEFIQSNSDTLVWYARDIKTAKFRPLFIERAEPTAVSDERGGESNEDDFSAYPLTSEGYRKTTTCNFRFEGQTFHPGSTRHWGVITNLLERVGRAGRILKQDRQIRMKYFWNDYPVRRLGSIWTDVGGAVGKVYVVQTAPKVLQRLFLMTTDPGDLVLDPTCGSGTTAYVAEHWGRRWITIDTSRVALRLLVRASWVRAILTTISLTVRKVAPRNRRSRAKFSTRARRMATFAKVLFMSARRTSR